MGSRTSVETAYRGDRRWPIGSVGEAYDVFRATMTWAEKKPRTREDWERGWRYIAPVFGDTFANTVTLELVDDWYAGILKGAGVREAWRAIKIWRALWNVMRAMNVATIADPSKGIRRKTPIPRRMIWQEHEVVQLAKSAVRRGYHGLACIIAVAWDAALSPVDARTLTFAQIRQDGPRIAFVIGRAKTQGSQRLRRSAPALNGLCGPTSPGYRKDSCRRV